MISQPPHLFYSHCVSIRDGINKIPTVVYSVVLIISVGIAYSINIRISLISQPAAMSSTMIGNKQFAFLFSTAKRHFGTTILNTITTWSLTLQCQPARTPASTCLLQIRELCRQVQQIDKIINLQNFFDNRWKNGYLIDMRLTKTILSCIKINCNTSL